MNNISEKGFSRILFIGGIFVTCLALMCCCFIGAAAADPQIVDGYYQITSTDDLTWFANQVDDGHVTYNAKLMNDLDYTDKTFTRIGTVTYRFAGVFEGNGYSIKNIGGNTLLMWGGYYFNLSLDSIELSTYVPFIDVIFNKCVFENISISSSNNAEICAGGTVTDCLFINCHATGTGSNGAIFQEVESVRCYFSNCYLTGSTTASLGRPTHPLSTTDCVIKSLNLQTTDSSYAKTAYFAKISGHTPTITNSYSSDTIVSSSNIEGATLYRGTVVSNTLLNNVNFYNGVGISGTTYLSWDFTNTWYWDSVNNMPKLRAFIHTPPTISSITDPASPVTINTAITSTVTASPTVSGDSLTYKWQVNTGSTWADISGQTTNILYYTPSVAGTYQFSCIVTESKIGSGLSATSNTVSCVAIIPYVDPIPNTPGAPIQPIPIPYTITLTASCSNEDQVQSYVWQLQTGGNWNNVSTSQQYEPVISVAGNYVYRFVAIGKNGNSIPSTSVTVNAGYRPSATISSPVTGTLFNAGESIDLVATVGGTTASYTWDFGNDVIEHGTQSGTINSQSETITSYVKYNQQKKGGKTITLTVTNIYDTAAVYTITIVNGASSIRPPATSTIKPVDASGIYNMINHTNPMSANNSMPNLSGMVSDLTKPITSIIGEWFYLIIFAVPYLIIFIRQKNLLIPSILGVMFAAFLFVMLPGVAMRAAIGILVLSIAGGIFGLYVKRQS